jgi:class 3 adenylate cyclase
MKSNLLKKKITRTLLISISLSVILSLLMFNGFLNTWETKISDAFYSPSRTLNEIVIVAIDDKSLRELGMRPWPRGYFAKVIDNLNRSKVIGVDVIFDLTTDVENDSKLAQSLKKAGNVVLAQAYADGKIQEENLLKPNATLGTPGVDFEIGVVNLYADSDGVVRSFTPRFSGAGGHFSVVVVEEFGGNTSYLGGSKMLINFFGLPGDYEYISFSDVYTDLIDASYFEGKIVLIGATSPIEGDNHQVPISNQAMPGVEIHANLIQSILTRDFLYYQDDVSATGLIFLFALLTAILLFRFRIHTATILLAALAMAYILFSIYYVFDIGIIMNILYPVLSAAVVYTTLVVVYYRTEERSRKWITSVFGKYVSPVVIENLIKNPERLKLGGERRNITVFFSDIRGFTSISERLPPEELVSLLNEYLTEMTSIIIKNQGLVDKFMGDAIMAFWGAPIDQADHAETACSSSLEMLDKLKELQKKWKKENIPSFDIGIGLNTGDAIVGNMGSFDRFDYTAMGDNVNLASRLEGLNKLYGTNIIISENTLEIVKDKFDTRKLDAVKVKGREKPILIYELLSQKDKLSKKQRSFVKLYETGLELYFERKWKTAIETFQKALEHKEDHATQLLIRRCQEFQKHPPPSDWNGVWEMETK